MFRKHIRHCRVYKSRLNTVWHIITKPKWNIVGSPSFQRICKLAWIRNIDVFNVREDFSANCCRCAWWTSWRNCRHSLCRCFCCSGSPLTCCSSWKCLYLFLYFYIENETFLSIRLLNDTNTISTRKVITRRTNSAFLIKFCCISTLQAIFIGWFDDTKIWQTSWRRFTCCYHDLINSFFQTKKLTSNYSLCARIEDFEVHNFPFEAIWAAEKHDIWTLKKRGKITCQIIGIAIQDRWIHITRYIARRCPVQA